MSGGSLRFEGRDIAIKAGDTVASALFRAGIRTFSRSLKYHRRRGLYCGTGECPNCLVTVDGRPGVRSCITGAHGGMAVRREGGWPSTEHDLLHVADRLHRLMPVGFYYKTFIRPRAAWLLAESVIRRATGLGSLPERPGTTRVVSRFVRTQTLVVGAGIAGLTAALDAAGRDEDVLVCDESAIGSRVPHGPTLETIRELERAVRSLPNVVVLDHHAAIGLYEGPIVPLASADELVRVRPERVVLATGATEAHPVFAGNDLPGVWLGRAAARMTGTHGVPVGTRVVVVASTSEGVEHLGSLVDAGAPVIAAVVPSTLFDHVPRRVEVIVDGTVIRAEGRTGLRHVVLTEGGKQRRIGCDALVCSVGLIPRDGLARMAMGQAVEIVGDAARTAEDLRLGRGGVVCLCEDVSVGDLVQARREGFVSAETLKRYTTATMGPCQGAMCGRALACFAHSGSGLGGTIADHRTTSRPPLRPVALGVLAASVHEIVEKRTGLHEVHVAAGARLDWSGGWQRPFGYRDRQEEYLAVRERVGIMDVGTLGKFLIAGRDAGSLVDRLFPTRVADLEPGGSRYVLALDETGFVVDDGMLSKLEDGSFLLTSTTGGAERMDARLREWSQRLELHVHVLDRTAELGAIVVAGPRARDLLQGLTEDALDAATLRFPGHREISVAGIACRAIRTGFVGETAFELYHRRSVGPQLWAELLGEGEQLGIAPHGLDTLELLRLEKGHPYLGQDTLPDDTPHKLGLGWAVEGGKRWFVGKMALERIASLAPARRLVGLEFQGAPGRASDLRGVPLSVDGDVVGRVTSAERSIVLDRSIGLGWCRSVDGVFPDELLAGDAIARVAPRPFYDPSGVRVRG